MMRTIDVGEVTQPIGSFDTSDRYDVMQALAG